jgi:hypothetical protein
MFLRPSRLQNVGHTRRFWKFWLTCVTEASKWELRVSTTKYLEPAV